jgi:hypothetical protein
MPIRPTVRAQSIGDQSSSARRPIFAVVSAMCVAAAIVALQTRAAVSHAFPAQTAPQYIPADVMRCSQRAWPYYESKCLRTYAAASRVVRIIPLDRLRSADVPAGAK